MPWRGIRMNADKSLAICEWLTQKTSGNSRRFSALVCMSRGFVKDLAESIAPLTTEIKK